MRLFNLFFNKKTDTNDILEDISPDFHSVVKRSIDLLGHLNLSADNEAALKLLVDNGINEKEAIEIIIFLPISFCRQTFKDLKWPDTYIVVRKDNSQTKIKYSDTPSYRVIDSETQLYFNNKPGQDTVLNIVARSAEFDAINKLLKDGGTLKDVSLTETAILK